MMTYSDLRRDVATGELLATLQRDLHEAQRADGELEPPQTLMDLFLTAGELAQGLMDAEFSRAHLDEWTPAARRCARLLLATSSLLTRPATPTRLQRVAAALQALSQLQLPEILTINVPEGYAFYALLPQLYQRSAERFWAANSGPLMVIGLRSIGTSLSAMVAQAARSESLPVTLRPAGDPFERTLQIGPQLAARLLGRPAETRFAIVDEGPGLSGSSFGSVADWLEDRGISPQQIHFFPGHRGHVGPHASARHRARWEHAQRWVTDLPEVLEEGLGFEETIPNRELRLRDISGGRWRAEHYQTSRDWPPAHPPHERQKYLYEAQNRTWVAKFAGLGKYGQWKLKRAELLAQAGFAPPVQDLRHGFLISEWLATARPVSRTTTLERGALIERIGDYLAFLARTFPADSQTPGFNPGALLRLARQNVRICLDADAAAALETWEQFVPRVQSLSRQVLSDNRMQPWEWLSLPNGEFLKSDGIDHHAGHDGIGAQDLAWDLAGATAEFDLDSAEQDQLCRRIAARCRYRPHPLAQHFYLLTYLGVQVGYYALAASLNTEDQDESARLAAASAYYAAQLRKRLG
jgi:hypothetical protein